MVSVFLSHSSQDKPFVRELHDFLTKDPSDQISVFLDERQITPGDNIVTKIQTGLDSDFVLLILSPDSVNSHWVREEWTDAFWDQTNNHQTKLLGVLYRDCVIPHLLRNKKYFDLRNNHLDGFRQIKSLLLNQKPSAPRSANQLPPRTPLFTGRDPELTELRRRLSEPGTVVHIAEMAGKGKTALAKEFAHRFQTDFEAVYWLPCESNSLSAIASNLERRLGLKLQKDLADLVGDLKDLCSQKRCLLILDNVDGEDQGQLIPGGVASVLITTRRRDLRFLSLHDPLKLPFFTEEQCFDLWRRALGTELIKDQEASCRHLFARLGHLPIAVSVAAGLIREDVRYTIASLSTNLPVDVQELIQTAIQALEETSRKLLAVMSACAPEGFALSLAAEMASLDETELLTALQQLVARSLAEELSRNARRYRLHALVRETAGGKPLALCHAHAIYRRWEKWETNWRQCEQELPDFKLALTWLLENQTDAAQAFPLGRLASHGYSLTKRIGRPAEALEICRRMERSSSKRHEDANPQIWLGNQALVIQAWGRLDEAFALHKKQEDIFLALGNRDGLQGCYGNQALILKAWGRLDEAFALHKKQEEICLALGSQNGLQLCYGNQALILQAWGRLNESWVLHKKQEEICIALEKQDALQTCYGNQAANMQLRGQLDEAFALYKKQEEVCMALGNREGLQRSYGNQALILETRGRLDDALALFKKQEEICVALSLKRDMAFCYWNWGLLERAFGHTQAEHEKLSTALAIFHELKMTRQREAVKYELSRMKATSASS